jgi:hypothetical protein
VHEAIGLDTRTSQRCPRSSPTNSSRSLPLSFCSFTVDTTTVNHSALTPTSPIENSENTVEDKESKNDGVWYVIYALGLFSLCSLECCYCREGVHQILDPALGVAQPTIKESPPPTDPVATIKPSPPVPPRVAGSKRKYVEDRSTYCSSINPPRKISKLPCVLYFTMVYLNC